VKRYIRDIAIFLVGLIAFNTVVYSVVAPLIRDDSYLADARNAPADTRAIVLADSHGTRLDGEVLASAGIVNLSTGSDSYVDMLNKLRYSIDHYPIRLVILSADGHSMSKYREYTNNVDKSGLLVGGNGVKAVIRRIVPLVDPKSRDLFKGAISAGLSRALTRRAATSPGPAAPSFSWKDKPNRRQLAERRAGTQFKFSEPSEPLRGTLAEIVALCAEHGIRLVGLKFPLSGDYLGVLGGKDYGADKVLESLGGAVLDYEELYRDRDDLFEDQDHLNKEGGTLFTRLLIEKTAE